jgi:hypothetical protein
MKALFADWSLLGCQVTASAELAALGSALGESLVAADLATIISHKRQATLRRTPSSALALHLEDHPRSLDAHRCARLPLQQWHVPFDMKGEQRGPILNILSFPTI